MRLQILLKCMGPGKWSSKPLALWQYWQSGQPPGVALAKAVEGSSSTASLKGFTSNFAGSTWSGGCWMSLGVVGCSLRWLDVTWGGWRLPNVVGYYLRCLDVT